MPQPRQRIVFCDCLDCVQQPATTDIPSSLSPANAAAARQEPPPKCLMFILSGVLLPPMQQMEDETPVALKTLLDACNIPHLHRATSQGGLCLLTQRAACPQDCCAELAQLLNLLDTSGQPLQPTTLADRFKGMQAAFASNSSRARDMAASAGLSSSEALAAGSEAVSAADQLGIDAAEGSLSTVFGGSQGYGKRGTAAAKGAARQDNSVMEQLPDPAEAARGLLQELGLHQADTGLDMVILHLDVDAILEKQQQQQHMQAEQQLEQQQQHGMGSKTGTAGMQEAAQAHAARWLLEWLDRTLRYLNNSDAFKDTVLLTVLATPGSGKLQLPVPMLQHDGGTLLKPNTIAGQAPLHQQQQVHQDACTPVQVERPLQSWQQLGGVPISICPYRPIVCLRRLPGVIRRDGCVKFTLTDCCESSAMLGMLVDRLIHEIAYKLGRAPKYGA